MKSVKMLGLSTLTALLIMALIGASSALAEETTLCKKDETPCPTKQIVSHVNLVTLPGAKAKLLSDIGVECDVLFLGDRIAGTSTPLEIESNFTYSNCGSCEVEE